MSIFTQYRVRYTPFIRNLWPLALLCGETITLSGYLYAVGFDDPDNPPDPSNKETNARDIYIRILAGGFACSHFTEDGEKYDLPSNLATLELDRQMQKGCLALRGIIMGA